MTHQSYLAYSEGALTYHKMALFEVSHEKYAEQYLYGRSQRISRNIALGSAMAQGLENDELTGNPLLDMIIAKLPKYELMDKPIDADLKDKKEIIKLRAKPDSAKADYSAFYEYKTSTMRWTQKRVDESDQITFYSAVIWLKTGKIPQDIKLICAKTGYDGEGGLHPTGEIWEIPTKRNLSDVIKITARARRAWAGIKKLTEEELL